MVAPRREFLKAAAACAAAAAIPQRSFASPAAKAMRLGLIVYGGSTPDEALRKVHDLGLPTAQLGMEDFSDGMVAKVRQAIERYDIEVTAINCSGPGPLVYDFYHGPETIGIVPRQHRQARIDQLKRASDFARKLDIRAIHTHCGFIPENPNDALYKEAVQAITEVVSHVRSNGQIFLFETGQETPITLLRAIEDVGLDNQRVNLDTANLILYGKGNPVDALDVLGKYVAGVHAKDGLFPTDPKNLGEEVPIGKGKANFPALIRRLKQLNYAGPLTIEREISGARQLEDIRASKAYLERLIARPE
jgi:sugar phosphate isomerase/epimerase